MKRLKTAVLFTVSCVVAVVVRVCQLLFMTEPETGFFYTNFETLGTLLTVLYVAIIAATAIISYAELRGRAKMPERGVAVTLLSAAAAVMLAAEAVSGLLNTESLSGMTVISTLLTLGTAAFFVFEALAFLNTAPETRRWLSLFPAAYWLIRVVSSFSTYMKMANISENLFDVAAMGFLTLFFLIYGKAVSQVDMAKSMRMLAPAGFCASILCLVCSLPRYAVLLFSDSKILHDTASPQPIFILMAVLVVLLIPRRVKKA